MADADLVTSRLAECAQTGDFAGAVRFMRENIEAVTHELNAAGVKDALKKATKDRLLLSFADGVEFGERPIAESLVRIEKLMAFQPGAFVLSKSLEWGLGVVKKLDYFYRRITVDFRMKKGHQFTYAAAVDMLTMADADHILAIQHSDPVRYETMLKDHPGEFVKQMLKSFGPMGAQRLEDVAIRCGFVKAAAWKAFWEKARSELRKDKLVYIPVRRSDLIELKASEEDYGEKWLSAFGHETDPKLILSGVREYVEKKGKSAADPANEAARATIGDRLAFAATAAMRVDDALYARLAALVRELGFVNPSLEAMRGYLWDRKRFIKAAATLPAREVGAMVALLTDGDAEGRERLCKAIPELCYTAVQEVVARFGDDPASRKTISDFMRLPKAPATLTTLFVGSYGRFKENWPELPPYISILAHAIALGEGRQGGETLRMQNIVRRLFADKNWLGQVFAWLDDADRALLFERFQASIAWDPSTHHTIVMRMVHLAPELESHVIKVEKKKDYARITSPRSYAMKKAEYLKLINVDMPENVRKIEEAKGYGDLSENAEYQYAKDEQRVLMQKQSLMQADLEAVKADEFKAGGTDEVEPGVTVTAQTPEGEKTYTILGEWDNDLELGIISSRTKLAANMLGKKVGDEFELPGEGMVSFGKILAIAPLSAEVRAWMAVPAGMQM